MFFNRFAEALPNSFNVDFFAVPVVFSSLFVRFAAVGIVIFESFSAIGFRVTLPQASCFPLLTVTSVYSRFAETCGVLFHELACVCRRNEGHKYQGHDL
jgi:hypothetical protein